MKKEENEGIQSSLIYAIWGGEQGMDDRLNRGI
jgi:hypothetical protein